MSGWRGLALLALLAGPAAAAVCDPHAALNDQARAQHAAKNLAAARASVQKVLASDKSDFRANYLLGIIMADESGVERPGGGDGAKIKAALAQLDFTVSLFAAIDPACARAKNYASVFNSAGAEHFNAGDYAGAINYLLQGYAKRDMMAATTQQKLLSNLGRVYYTKHDYRSAAHYYDEAAKAGAPSADRNRDAANELAALTAPKKMAPVGRK